jgi:HK97 gp10 family phage protein
MKWYEPEKKIRQAVVAGLTASGIEVHYHAQNKCPVDTTNLKRSLNWKIRGNAVYIGTPVEYGIYQEFGTGLFAEKGNGRKTGWAYKDEKTGKIIFTRGNRPHPFLRPALDKVRQYIDKIFMKEFKRILS